MKQQHLVAALALALAACLPATAAIGAGDHRPRHTVHHVKKHRTVVHRHVRKTVKRTTTTTRTRTKSSSGATNSSSGGAGGKPSGDAHSSITKPGDYNFAILQDGRTRAYRVHVPPGYTPSEPAPLVVALRPGNADRTDRDGFYGLVHESDRQGFVVVIADPYRDGKTAKAAWNAGEAAGARAAVNDVAFIEKVVNNVFGQMSISRQHIYAAGMSDGGMMAYRLACKLPYVFTAVASVAGTDNTPDCTPDKPVSILHLHARNDRQVPFDGGPDPLAQAKVARLTSAPQTVAKWAKLDGCMEAPQPVLQQAGATCEAYSYCRGQTEVRLCTTDTGGHSWPGALARRGEDKPSQAISATRTIWAFFSAH
ncbi:MAG TPA: PHB depolymerase family esterase [Ramlibacter sp.]|nr:PHB depolymerase family esterase [Ramlibacter sp.]